jgi:hypothetical protein
MIGDRWTLFVGFVAGGVFRWGALGVGFVKPGAYWRVRTTVVKWVRTVPAGLVAVAVTVMV